MPSKDVSYNIRLDPLLRDEFRRAVEAADISGGAVLRKAMKDFIASQAQPALSLSAPKAKKGGKS